MTWEEFIEDGLLKTGLLSGVLLVTHQGKPVYKYGKLADMTQESMAQFTQLFMYATPRFEARVRQQGFHVHYDDGTQTNFTIFEKTYCSVYSTSEADQLGLVVCNLPYAVLICLHASSRSPQAIPCIEQFCDSMRA